MGTEHYLVHVLGIIPKFRAKVCAHCTMSFNTPRCVCCQPFKGPGGDLGLVLSPS